MGFEGFWDLGPLVSIIILILIVIAALFLLCLLVALTFSLCRRYQARRIIDRIHPGVTDNLIPPIFFTDRLQDPLHQEDLREKIDPRKL
jgi:hypothetical protein